MANVRAFRSGAWSDTNPATSPWGTGGALYAPAAGDDVYSNTYTIHVDQNVTVNSVTNGSATSRLWKDGATTTATVGGKFTCSANNITIRANIVPQNTSSAATDTACLEYIGTSGSTIYVEGTVSCGMNNTKGILNSSSGKIVVVGTIPASNVGINSGHAIVNNSSGTVEFVGTATAGLGGSGGALFAIHNTSGGIVSVTGSLQGGTGAGANGINNSSVGTIIVTGNVTAGTGSAAYGINNSSTGTAIIVGNVVATSATNAFVSSNAIAINKISGNLINNSNGTAAIYATRYVVDPVPTNSVIQYSNTNMFTTDSLSAFSMPPVSAVRSGVSFANSTLTGTCKVPSANSVNIGVPVDNTVGTAFLNPATLFDASVASLTASNSLGARLRNSATVQSVGNIIASFSN